MIRNVVFDVGEVLVHFRWKELLWEDLGVTGERFEHVAAATVRNEAVWNEVDRSRLSDEELIRRCVASQPAYEPEIRSFFGHLDRLVSEYPGSADWLAGLKRRGLRLYLLSNYGRTAFESAKGTFRFYPQIDGEVISYQIQELKPEEPIYRALLEKYALRPEETVFLDDREENIATARRLGMYGIVVTSQEQAKRELDELLARGA